MLLGFRLGNDPSHSTSKEALDSLGKYVFVDWGSVECNSLPLASFGFYDCSALAVCYTDHSGGLAHVKHDPCVPDGRLLSGYLDRLIDSSLAATFFVAANSDFRIESIVRMAQQRGARVGGSFLFPECLGSEPKDVIVFPYFRQVRIYSSLGIETRTI
ncbi:hypothetical protein HYT55_05170 [Candidatus Woesearchaeota archaeon]|nr:hypothetical protein [Candidatus Woesearchaeota archaeon]